MPLFKRAVRHEVKEDIPDTPVTTESGEDVNELNTPSSDIRRLKDTLREEIEEVRSHHHRHERWYRKNRILFPLGITLGLIFGLSLIPSESIPEFHEHVSLLLSDLPGVKLPNFDLSRVEAEWLRLRDAVQIPEVWKLNTDGREFQVGEDARKRGLSAKYPVVLVPGIISTGLESWSTEPSYRELFRVRVWGGLQMVSQVMFNREKWITTMMLDPVTGLDPPGVKVRAAEGIEAASSFIQGYWLWSKIIENLAVVNYDTNNLYLAPYDWRLSYHNLEERDGYFSRLKGVIEDFKKRQRQKIVLAAHSMGSTVCLYFMKWVESPEHGAGGPDWVENHIEAIITIGGTHLGVAKSMAAFLSGEMKDTVQVNPAGAYVLERFFSKKERQKLFLSWAGGASLWIKGGAAVWGGETGAPDDPPNATHTHGQLISFRTGEGSGAIDAVSDDEKGVLVNRTTNGSFFSRAAERVGLHVSALGAEQAVPLGGSEEIKNMTAGDAGNWILTRTPTTFQKMMATNYSLGLERDESQLKRNNMDPTKWSNPLEIQLPNAPSMKMFCVYGHGKETERSYWYARGEYEYDDTFADALDGQCTDINDPACKSSRPPLDMPLSRRSWIDFEYSDSAANPKVLNGVKMGEGDGTVSLLSLGAMCAEGWKKKRYNPGNIKVITVELPHNPTPTIPRGGANTSDHVDILGSTRLNEIIVKVATGAGEEVQDSFVSEIRAYAKRIQWD